MDTVIPIVFPDYLIVVNERPVDIRIPDLIPGRDLFPDFIRIPVTKLPELGHAGVLLLSGETGTTKYYEYGRYDRAALGWVMRRPIPDAKTDRAGRPTLLSLRVALRSVSRQAGQNGRIAGAFIELRRGSYDQMVAFAHKRLLQNSDPQRTPYSLATHSCLHFMKEVAEAGGADMPVVVDPRPAGYIERVRRQFPTLDYNPTPESLTVPVLDTQQPATRSAISPR